MRTLCRAPFPHVDAMTRPRSMTICASRRRPMTICASHYVCDQHLVCSSLCLTRGFSFCLALFFFSFLASHIGLFFLRLACGLRVVQGKTLYLIDDEKLWLVALIFFCLRCEVLVTIWSLYFFRMIYKMRKDC